MATSNPSMPRHGGDLAFATARYGHPAGSWLDLSTGINPVPYPAPDATGEALSRLPDATPLLDAARAAYGVPDDVAMIAAPGSELAIRLLPQAAPSGLAAIVTPTYGSHSAAWRVAERPFAEVASLDDLPSTAAVIVVGNPNNPDGRILSPETLVEIARNLGERDGLLIVDEAFADVTPEMSLVPHLSNVPALVLRSLGKFYGLPGLRLGFIMGDAPTTGRLAALLGDWPVSGPAIVAGIAALGDSAWRDRTREQLAANAESLRDLLAQLGLTVAGGTNLFIWIEDENAFALHESLARQGIWTRAFAELPNNLRVGLPGNDADFARLEAALSAAR